MSSEILNHAWMHCPAELRAKLPPDEFTLVESLFTSAIRKAKWANFGSTVEFDDGAIFKLSVR